MSDPFLWAIDYSGSLLTLSLETCKWHRITRTNLSSRKNSFKRVSSTSTCAWAIGGDQDVYMSVFETDLPIRQQVSCYENQRWSIRYGWSVKSLLFTDRWAWSSKNGKIHLPKDSFELSSTSWVWEGDWFVDESIDCDIEGWEYAIDFPATYHKQPGRFAFARRRKWSRNRKFVGFNKWNKIPSISDNDPIQDITIGGYNIPGQTQGFLAVWAITFLGKVKFRSGVTRSCPEGEQWIDIPTDELNLVQVSVGPTGLLWGCTWDGAAVVRKGISHSEPTGTSWEIIAAPLDNPLFQVAVGEKSLWSITKSAKVFYRRNIESENVCSRKGVSTVSSWVEMCGSFSFISVGPNEQVFAIGQEDKRLYIRTNVVPEELVGREWKLLKMKKGSEKAGESSPLHLTWIDSGACDVDATYFNTMGGNLISSSNLLSVNDNVVWRNEVLKGLYDRNSKEISNTKQYQSTHEAQLFDSYYNKRGQGILLVDKLYDIWCKCHIKLLSGWTENHNKPSLLIYYSQKVKYEELVYQTDQITCVHRLLCTSRPYTFGVQMCYHGDDVKQVLVLNMENEKTMNEWMTAVSRLQHNLTMKASTEYITLWATSVLGDVFSVQCNSRTIQKDMLASSRWTQVSGLLKRVVSGHNGVTWGVGSDGKAYVYSGTDEKKTKYEQKTTMEHFIYENQRWNPVEGYTDRLLPSDRWHWSDESGMYDCSKENYRLPSLSCKWLDDWTIDYNDHTDNQGWQYAVDFPRVYHKTRGLNDYVRRRRWKRACKITTTGPWLEVKTDVKIIDISVNIEDDVNASSVWAVSCNGDVMARNDVTACEPQGTSWSYIPTDIPVTSISVGVKSRVWCVCRDGSCYLRAGFGDTAPYGTTWFHVPKEDLLIHHISVGHYTVLALDEKGTMFSRCDVGDVYPEGTRWQPVLDNVSAISVNSQDQVCFIQQNDVKVLLNGRAGVYDDISVLTLLVDGWTGICCRSIILPVSSPPKAEETSEDMETFITDVDQLNIVDESVVNDGDTTDAHSKVDPYAIDIYNFYKAKENTEADS